ncbi:MAG: hypothetical protein HY314_07590 [Acidobacteria bacterium]|nr:hypothetical protein [Acidobacteriota bacterium]
MNIWHLTPDAPRSPHRVSADERVTIEVGTWPIEMGQSVWAECEIVHPGGATENQRATASWQQNRGPNSYWQASLGPFADGDRVVYTIRGSDAHGEVTGLTTSFTVGPKLYLALLWHQHQPIYKDTSYPTQAGSYIHLADIRAMVAEQYKIMRAIVPLHRQLQEQGQIEVSTTPFYHPILPLLVDTDRATIDQRGTTHPRRFAHPEDAEAQVRLAVEYYQRCFGRPPRGMWPAEGAVSQFVVPFFAWHGVRWIATDRGVLARSGRWGYQVDNPDVLCQPYRADEGPHGGDGREICCRASLSGAWGSGQFTHREGTDRHCVPRGEDNMMDSYHTSSSAQAERFHARR